MAYGFLDIARTPSVKAAQAANGSAAYFDAFKGDRAFDRFTDAEEMFIAGRDSFYMASVSESGWPYIQHRGGIAGFLHVIDDRTLAFADYRGNRQYISVGNIGADSRVAVILIDYANRTRLKIYARAEISDLGSDPILAAALAQPVTNAKAERAILLHLEAFDWNCPQHITPRLTEAEVNRAIQPLRQRLIDLEAENDALKARLGDAA